MNFIKTWILAAAGILLAFNGSVNAADELTIDAEKNKKINSIDAELMSDRSEVLHNVTSTENTFEEALLGNSCDTGCGQCGSCGDDKLFGLFARSDHAFSNYISPMTNPVFFEDPRTLTELRIVYLNHRLPTAVPGDYVNLFAAQMRFALNDRLSIIATKDGFITTDGGLPAPDGWADVSAGLKYNLFADECNQRLLSVGLTYELPVGSTRTLQARGDGEFHLFASGAAQLPAGWQWMTGSGFRLPSDTVDNNQMWYWSNHFDHKIGCNWYFLTEVNWFYWMSNGNSGIGVPSVGGHDIYNFGAPDVAGKSLVTGAIGIKYKPHCHTEIGVAWEAPLTSDHDLIDNRLTVDWIFRF